MGPAREGGGKWGGGARDQQAGQAASRRLLSGPSITPGAGRGGGGFIRSPELREVAGPGAFWVKTTTLNCISSRSEGEHLMWSICPETLQT